MLLSLRTKHHAVTLNRSLCLSILPCSLLSLSPLFFSLFSPSFSPRFHAFLLFLGHPAYGIREVSVHRFSKIVSEFALEYRTTRDRVLQQKQKRANHRERNKTRGKMITDVSHWTAASWPCTGYPHGGPPTSPFLDHCTSFLSSSPLSFLIPLLIPLPSPLLLLLPYPLLSSFLPPCVFPLLPLPNPLSQNVVSLCFLLIDFSSRSSSSVSAKQFSIQQTLLSFLN